MKTPRDRFLPAALILLLTSLTWATSKEAFNAWRNIQFTDSKGKTHDLWCRVRECGRGIKDGRAALYVLEEKLRKTNRSGEIQVTYSSRNSNFEYVASAGRGQAVDAAGAYEVADVPVDKNTHGTIFLVEEPSGTGEGLARNRSSDTVARKTAGKGAKTKTGGTPGPAPKGKQKQETSGGAAAEKNTPAKETAKKFREPTTVSEFEEQNRSNPSALKDWCKRHEKDLMGGGAAAAGDAKTCFEKAHGELSECKGDGECIGKIAAACDKGEAQTPASATEGALSNKGVKARCTALIESNPPPPDADNTQKIKAVDQPAPYCTDGKKLEAGKCVKVPPADDGKWLDVKAGVIGAAGGAILGVLGGPTGVVLGALAGFALFYAANKVLR